MAALAGNAASLYIVAGSGAGSAFTDEATTGDAGRTTYQIDNTGKRYWSTATAVVVKVDAVTVAETEYQIQHAGGKIHFVAARGAMEVVTVTGGSLSTSELGEGFEWSADIQTELLEDTAFSDTWKSFVVTVRGGTVTFKRWWVDEYFLTNVTSPILMALYYNESAGSRLECTGYMTQQAINAVQSGLIDESITLSISGPVHYVAS